MKQKLISRSRNWNRTVQFVALSRRFTANYSGVDDAMLVTLCWWLYDGDRVKLSPAAFVFNIRYLTYVINIDVAFTSMTNLDCYEKIIFNSHDTDGEKCVETVKTLHVIFPSRRSRALRYRECKNSGAWIHWAFYTYDHVHVNQLLKNSKKNSKLTEKIDLHHILEYELKWSECSRWLSSLYCPMRNSDQMAIGKTHSTLYTWLPGPGIIYPDWIAKK